MHEFSVDVGGVSVQCAKAGDGPPLVLVHGLIGSGENWRRNVESFSRSATVYAVDLPNMGRSGRVLGMEASLRSTAEFLVRLLDCLGLEQADVAAHSRGGAVAMTLATMHPERVRSLVLFAPANPFCGRSRGMLRFYRSRFGRMFARVVPWLPRGVKAIALQRMYGDRRRVPSDALRGYIDGLRVPGTIEHVLGIVRSWASDMRWLERRLERLRSLPVLLIWGDRDRAVGVESGYELQRRLGEAQLRLLRGVGHIAFEEVPELVNPMVARWLRGLSHGGGDELTAR